MVLPDVQLYSAAICVVVVIVFFFFFNFFFFYEITILTPKYMGRLKVYESLFVFLSINPRM